MASNDSPVNIDALTIYMQRKLEDLSPSKGDDDLCIYRVNQKFRKINPYAFIPEIVSIGPFHHQQESLLAMKEHKLRCVKTFLPTESHIRQCIQHMAELLVTRDFYESIKIDNNTFVQMMILDGIFIIHLFENYRSGQENPSHLNNLWSNIASLKRDILLLENQLPMRVLVHLLKYRRTQSAGSSSSSSTVNHDSLDSDESYAIKLSLRFFDGLIIPRTNGPQNIANLEGKHLLDLLGNTLHPATPDWPANNYRTASKSVPCVTELKRAGVKFRRGPSTNRLLDISYNKGTIVIPTIVIDDLTETLLRNLIAYEQCSYKKKNYMISYAFFMDCLIDSEEDVRILCKKDIIVNTLGNDREVCNIFNTLCNEATLENFYYSNTCDKVNEYYRLYCNRNLATLRRDYFQNPWTIISVLAALLLVILTIIQTIASILQVMDNTTEIDFGTSARDWLVKLLDKNNTNSTNN